MLWRKRLRKRWQKLRRKQSAPALTLVYRSHSWRITALMRAAATILRH
jgi:hypothetical protein